MTQKKSRMLVFVLTACASIAMAACSGKSTKSESPAAPNTAAAASGAEAAGSDALTNSLNQMSADQMAGMGISKDKAQKIVDYRDKYGEFKSIEDLQKVPGLDQATIDRLKGGLSTGSVG